MQGPLSRLVVVLASASALGACTILTGVGDLLVEEGAPDASEASSFVDAGPNAAPDGASPPTSDGGGGDDGGGLGDIDATVVDACSAAACELLPDGFQLAALGATTAPCPTGFGQPFDGVESPTLESGACTCGCTMNQPPSCNVPAGNDITLLYGPFRGGACPSTGQAVPTGCSTDGYHGPFIDYDRRYLAPQATLTGGTCGASATKNAARLKTTPARVCQATTLPQCEGKTCPPDATPFATCIAANGTQPCPAGWPDRHVVGSSASFTCGAGCTCNVQGQCSATGSLRYFASANCSGAAGLVYPVTGTCVETAGTPTTFGSHRYDPNPPTNVSCQSGGSSAASTPVLAQATTVCCK